MAHSEDVARIQKQMDDLRAELVSVKRLKRHVSTLCALLSGVAVEAVLDENVKRIRDTSNSPPTHHLARQHMLTPQTVALIINALREKAHGDSCAARETCDPMQASLNAQAAVAEKLADALEGCAAVKLMLYPDSGFPYEWREGRQ